MLSFKKMIFRLKRVEQVKIATHMFSLLLGVVTGYNIESFKAGFIAYLLTFLGIMFLIHSGEINELKKRNREYLNIISELTKNDNSNVSV